MNRGQGGKSVLTSNSTLLLYYACGLMTLVTGISFFLAAVGALISRSVAHKEGAPFVIQHCTWIFRSLWVGGLLFAAVFFTALQLAGGPFLNLPDTSHIQSFEQLWADPTLRKAVQYALAYVCVGGMVILWFVYRMLRGMYMLIQGSPPVKLY